MSAKYAANSIIIKILLIYEKFLSHISSITVFIPLLHIPQHNWKLIEDRVLIHGGY